MRTIDPSAMRELFAAATDRAGVWLMTVDHPSLAEPKRFATNRVAVTHGGETYQPMAFGVIPAKDVEDGRPEARVTFSNVSQALVPLTRTVSDPPAITLEAVSVDSAGVCTTIWGPVTASMLKRDATAATMEIALGDDDVLNRPATRDKFTPGIAPGLFQ